MSSPYIGEIRMFAGSFAPNGWAFCNGALIPISENDTLFNLIGTTYGGDGQTTFALPDLQGRAPVHRVVNSTTTYTLGEKAGVETVTLTASQIPTHNHAFLAQNGPGNQPTAVGFTPAASNTVSIYKVATPAVAMASVVQPTGGSQPHDNMQPYLTISFIISLFGIFPSTT